MLLFDLRLKFARELIGHWLEIRRGALVPLEADLDPRALLPSLERIGIIDLTRPRKLIIEQAGASMRRRFGCEIRHRDWLELVPPIIGEAGQRARERIRTAPCGFYHRFTIARDGTGKVTGEALVLPLRSRNATLPHAVIGMTREVGTGSHGTPPGWLAPSAPVAQYVMEFVEIQ